MMTPIASLNLLMLVLSWHSNPALTYLIETSTDLLKWDLLPLVMEGSGQVESFHLEVDASPFFARLRFSADGDPNENGLPDLWEWQQFGYLGVDPEGDPDLDGKSTYVEWLEQTDPLNFYDSGLPVIHLPQGKSWLLKAGTLSPTALAIHISHPSGQPWPNAPVHLRVESGYPSLAKQSLPQPETVSELTLWTDERGYINPWVHSIHLLANEEPGSEEIISIDVGEASAQLCIRVTGQDFGQPPRQLNRQALESGEIEYTWSGEPESEAALIIEERDQDGHWTRVIELASGEIAAHQTETGRFSLRMNHLQN